MAKVETHTCDDCGTEVPAGDRHTALSPARGWMVVMNEHVHSSDFCSAACLAAWSARLAAKRLEVVVVNRAEVDELEALLAAPAASRPRKKPAPRKTKGTP
jgi:hypothetical protein